MFPGFYTEDPDVFLDAFDFWDQNSGIAFGDAINVGYGTNCINNKGAVPLVNSA